MNDLECSLCTNTLDIGPHLAQVVAITALAFPVASIEVDGWMVHFTGTDEPTVLCDRCITAHGSFEAALEQLVARVAEKHRDEVPASTALSTVITHS